MPRPQPQGQAMRRRDFIKVVAGSAAGWPLAAYAQPAAMPVIGYLDVGSPDGAAPIAAAFRRGLAASGHVEGRNVAIKYRWADGRSDRLPELAADLVRQNVNVIATPGSTAAALAAKATTTTIPIIFAIGADPVAAGLVPSLNRPGGNVTGVATLNAEVGPKRVEMLHQVIPEASIVALLVNPTNPVISEPLAKDALAAARTLGIRLNILQASSDAEIEAAFAALHGLQVGGLVIGSDQFFNSRSRQLAALALQHSLPAIYQYREFTAAGGLISYGASLNDAFHLAGVYTARILNGEKPADLPVQQSTKVEMTINLKTAKALGLTIPPSLLVAADEVIE
jgi:putative tryptophan/tyrosine transport system substrate-binding protein